MSDPLTVNQKALLAIKRLQERVAELEEREHEPIAVIGIGCRFPKADTYEAFGENLRAGRDLVGELPENRYEALGNERIAGQRVFGAFVDGVEYFDAPFFRISREECATLDPQQRFLLETAWEALEDAGLSPKALDGTATGVFVGVSNADYRILLNEHRIAHRYRTTGASFAAAAGRISYFLGTDGPSITVDTACSSSLVAVQLACQSLRTHRCSIALAGGANLMVAAPLTNRMTEQASMLSPTGKCHTFDAAADGYVRGEGAAMIALKRLKDALKDGDPIHAVIRGIATNHNGATSGLTVPGPDAQAKLAGAALADARIAPADVQYVEAHGTGTALGDPIEMRGLNDVYGDRPASKPLFIGSVKTNIGHLENAAGIAGLIKVIVALEGQALPPHLNLATPNPHIPWDELPVSIPTGSVPWISKERPRVAAVSSFGFVGSNVHAIVEEAPREADEAAESAGEHHLLTISAASKEALAAQIARYVDYLSAKNRPSFSRICFTTNVGRAHLRERCAVVATTCDEAVALLRSWVAKSGAEPPPAAVSSTNGGRREQLLQVAARYERGEALDLAVLAPARAMRKVRLPTYAFQRQRYWFDDLLAKPFSERAAPPRKAVSNLLYEVRWERKDLPAGA